MRSMRPTPGSGAAVHLFDGLQRSDVTSVDLDRHAFLELDDDFIFDRREGRVVGVGVAVLGRAVPRILKEAGLNGAAPHVLVDGVRGLLGLGDRQLVLLGERNLDVAGQGQVANRADGLQRRVDGAMETSKRTWSLPLPVQPWEMVSAPNWWAARTRCLEMSGREMAENQRVDAFVRWRWP